MTEEEIAKNHLRIESFLLVIFAALAVPTFWIAAKWPDLRYISGNTREPVPLHETYFPGDLYCVAGKFFALVMAGLVVLALCLFIRRLLLAKRGIQVKRRFVLLKMAVLFLVVLWGFFGAPLGTQLGDFRQWAKANTDIGAVRDWAASLKDVPAGTEIHDWPPAVKKLNPNWVTKSGPGQVRIGWSDYYRGDRTIIIGPSSMSLPVGGRYEWIRPLESGAYAYYGCAG